MNALTLTRTAVRTTTVAVMSTAVMTATGFGFAQSYAGLYGWALAHRLSGWKADSFPLLVDLFILVGELGLFLLALDGHKLKARVLPWADMALPFATATAGWLVSLWFNVGHVVDASRDDKVTAGVPPVTAMIGLLILLRTVHRYTSKMDQGATGTEPVHHAERADVPAVQPADVLAQAPDVPERAVEPSQDVPEHMPVLTGVPVQRAIGTKVMNHHPLWNTGVERYTESVRTGTPMSQRMLAESLWQANRVLAKSVIDYVKGQES